MSQSTSVGIIGGGWPGIAHARGYRAAGGFHITAVADLIPQRRAKLAQEAGQPTEYSDAAELLADPKVEAVSICLPTHLHEATVLAALKAGKHVVCETPPAIDVSQTRRLSAAAAKRKRILLYAYQRRFGGAELAVRQAIEKGYAGDIYHARAAWMRTRGIPIGTGWYTDRAKSGGGALLDLGSHLLDVAWLLLGEPAPISVTAITHQAFRSLTPPEAMNDVEDFAAALLRFNGGKTLELSCAWAINQPPSQNGTLLRLHGSTGAIDVYTPHGPVLHRHFDAKGAAKETPLKQPRITGHAAMLRHFRDSILHNTPATPGPEHGLLLMQLIAALYKSAETGKTVDVKGARLSATMENPPPAGIPHLSK